jgi:hypothetical protein
MPRAGWIRLELNDFTPVESSTAENLNLMINNSNKKLTFIFRNSCTKSLWLRELNRVKGNDIRTFTNKSTS